MIPQDFVRGSAARQGEGSLVQGPFTGPVAPGVSVALRTLDEALVERLEG